MQKTWKSGVSLVALFSLHLILGGHPLATISDIVFLSLFALGVSISRRSLAPFGYWAGGFAVAVLVSLPLLVPLLEGFFATARAQGVALDDMQMNNIPADQFLTSLLFGMAIWILNPPVDAHVTYTLAFSSCAAAWCIIPAMVSRAKWQGLEVVTVALVLFGILIVIRPILISEIMMRLPVFRSMRWPFRELVQFQFFFHLFLLLRPPGLTVRARTLTAIYSAGIMVVPMFLYIIPPTLNEMPRGRELIFSGDFDRYWTHVRPLLKSTDRVAVLMPYNVYMNDRVEKPNGLLDSFNYAMLARVINASGYSHTAPESQLYTRTIPYYPSGAYEVRQKGELMRERPDLKFITLESVDPVRITLDSLGGTKIDLTPFVPKEFLTR